MPDEIDESSAEGDGGEGGEDRSPSSDYMSERRNMVPDWERVSLRNFIAFWLLGLCNNFGYVVMLSAARDILERSDADPSSNQTGCIENLAGLGCSPVSTGAVLLADILPSLAVKLVAPFVLQPIPYLVRHSLVLVFQSLSFLIVAFSSSIATGLLGVVFASLGAGLGEVTYLSLSSHFHSDVVSGWSSGTGGAGIFGALAFAVLTDHRLLALSPRMALLLMLLVPAILFLTFWRILQSPASVRRVSLFSPRTWSTGQRLADDSYSSLAESVSSLGDDLQSLLHRDQPETNGRSLRKGLLTRLRMIRPLLAFMVPLTVVYLAEYFINQGLLELLVFDCAHSFGLSPLSQYRWYQVLYQLGVFVSRSSVNFFPVRASLIPLMGFLQMANAVLLLLECFRLHFPHILLLMVLVFYEGLLGGSAYVNTFAAIHKTVARANREFAIAFVCMSDSLGIVMAGFLSIYAHNFICSHR